MSKMVKRMNRKVFLFVGFGLLGALLGGCGRGHFSDQTVAGKENIFRYSLVTNPTHVDPALVQDGDTIDLTQQVFEGLVKWDENNKVVPNLAESWKVDSTGTVYTFKIRSGIKFTNGKPLTANDFKFSIERTCGPFTREDKGNTISYHSETAEEYLGDIVGVVDRVHDKASDVRGVKVIDDQTLEITIDKPKPYFIMKLTYPNSFAVQKDAVKPGKEMLSVDEMVGTGPFKAKRYVEDQIFVLDANKEYHEGAPPIDGIERPILKDATTRLNKFIAGEVDLVQLERQDVSGVQGNPKLKDQLKFFPRPATWYLAFNTKVYPPFADKRVRQAFCMAIDTKNIVNETLGGVNTVADGILPPGVLGHRDNATTLPYDPAKAKALLAQAGFESGSAMPPLQIFFRKDREDVKLVVEAVQAQLQKNLGVTISPRPLEWTTYLDRNNRKEFPFYHMRWAADYLDPQNFLSTLLATDGPENKQNFSDPEFDKLCATADTTMPADNPERLAMYAKAEDMVLQDAAWLPIYFQKDAELISPRVHGLRESLFGHLPHTKVSLGN
jgi:ABC-type transport system substrate-binding protein